MHFTQEIYVDGGRLFQKLVVSPGEHIFLFADVLDLPWQRTRDAVFNYMEHSKHILYMGQHARLHNEVAQFPSISLFFNGMEVAENSTSDMDYLMRAAAIYKGRMNHLNNYIREHPTVSDRFREFQTMTEKYELAQNLMQHRFYKREKRKVAFDTSGYIQYVKDSIIPDGLMLPVIVFPSWETFVTDYVGYHKNLADSLHFIEGKGWQSNRGSTEPVAEKIEHIETVIQHRPLRELWIAGTFYSQTEQERQPFNEADWAVIHQKIENPYLLDRLTKASEYYAALNNKTIPYAASLVNTSHLKESKDADLLFKQLLEPYRGKVIYLDFWGTWCSPCREEMQYVGALKKELADKDVVFMYFANSSPQKAWESFIKEMDLTGRNIVHYRLPDEQQRLLERRLMVNSFPTFMLVNKNGELVNTNAPRPSTPGEVVQAVDELLK